MSTWYDETEMCFMRNSSGWFLGAKGGHNDESHNHNDIGTCIFSIRNIPVLVDAGVGTYTKATFDNKERYKIWAMRCEWHNLPMINGVQQEFGGKYKGMLFTLLFDSPLRTSYFLYSLPDSAPYAERQARARSKGKSMEICFIIL